MGILSTVSHHPVQAVDQNVWHDTTYGAFRDAQQIGLQPNTQHSVFVTTESRAVLTTELRSVPLDRHETLAAFGIIDATRKQPYHIYVSDFSGRQVFLLKHVTSAQCKTPPVALRTVAFID